MGEKRNFAALDWVIGEIEETLKEAREALEAYVEDTRDSSRIRFCLTYIHQVLGSLQMVEFHGASLLAEEMEQAAQAIMNNSVASGDEAQEVLMRSLLQLPIYLEHVKNQKEDQPSVILPLLNDLRAVRKQGYLSETNLFTPDLSAIGSLVGSKHPVVSDKAKLRQVLKKLREMYQFAAAGVLRDVKTKENLKYLDKVCSRMEVLTLGTQCYPTWEVSAAMIEAVCQDDLELSVAVKGLLRYLARELRILGEKAPSAMDVQPKESLLKNLLYYVALSRSSSPRVASVKERYGLDGAKLNGQAISSELNSEGISGPDPDAVRTVIVALNEEIASIRNVMDAVLSGKSEHTAIRETLPTVKRVADALAVLGIGDLRKQVVTQQEILEQLVQDTELDEPRLVEAASNIAEVEQRLEAISKVVGTNRDLSKVDGREVEIDQAKETVVKECQHGLEQIKDAIVAYHSSKWDKAQLENVGSLLTNIRGGLDMIPLRRPSAILDSCNAYIREQLLDRSENPAWKSLETLADAISSVEYYLERLLENVDDEVTLEIAEQSVKMLAYPVTTKAASLATAHASMEQDAGPGVVVDMGGNPSTTAVEIPGIPEPETEFDQFEEADRTTDLQPANEESVAPVTTVPKAVSPPEPESDIDDEIVEIFIEEAGEVKETLDEYFPQWKENFQNQDALVVVRRAFHTLKGSGRMVEAYDIGELAWSVENMLNRVIDNTVSASSHHAQLIDRVLVIIPALIDAFATRQPNPHPDLTEQYMAWGKALTDGELPEELASTEDAEPIEDDTSTIELKAIDETQLEDDKIAAEASVESESPAEDTLSEGGLEEQSLDVSEENTTPELVAAEYPDEDVDEENLVLREIFSSEAYSHLQTVEEYISASELEAPIYSPPSDDLQRALHTLKGSAKMAQVLPIAAMAEPLEAFTKELISYQVHVNADILQLLRDTVTYTTLGLEQMEQGSAVQIPRLEQFLARTAELREIAIGHLLRKGAQEATSKVDPQLLAIFMAEEIKLLLDARELLDRWQRNELLDGEVDPLINELGLLEKGATQANLPELANLSHQLQTFHTQAQAGYQPSLDDFIEIAIEGHDALLDIIDQVAAGQNVMPPPDELKAALDDLILAGQRASKQAEESSEELIEEEDSLFSTDIEANLEQALMEEGFELRDELDDAPDEPFELDALAEEDESSEELVIEGDDESLGIIDYDELREEEDDNFSAAFDLGFEEEDKIEPTIEMPAIGDISLLDEESDSDFEQQVELESLADDEVQLELDSEGEAGDDVPILAEELIEDKVEDELKDAGVEFETVYLNLDSDEDYEAMPSFDGSDFEPDASELQSLGASFASDKEELLEAISEQGENVSEPETEDIPTLTELSDDNQETQEPVEPVTEPQVAASAAPNIVGLLDDLDRANEDFDADIIDVFLEEANELMEDMDEAVHSWEADWSNLDAIEEINRALHTLKGGARLSGLNNLGELTHEYESDLVEIKPEALDEAFFRKIQAYQDKLLSGVRAVQRFMQDGVEKAQATTGIELSEVTAEVNLEEAATETPVEDTATPEQEAVEASTEKTIDPAQKVENSNILPFAARSKPAQGEPGGGGFRMPSVSKPPAASSTGTGGGAPQVALRKSSGPQEVIKVSADLLEELVNLAGETSISRGRLEEQISDFGIAIDEIDGTLSRLQEQLRRLDIETEAQIIFRQEQMAQDEEFDPLEMDRYSALQQLSRSLMESASDLEDLKTTLSDKLRDTETLLLQQSRINTTLQEGLMRSRMVPFSRLVPRLRRIVRQVATELGKSVNFELDNVEGELDRSVLERMIPPLEHMLRNAVDHGIELPGERIDTEKPETGRIVLALGREGGDVLLRLADDGRGINLERVRQKAIERGLMSEEADLSDYDIMQFILHAGFSTAENVTQISGRGVGMDVVSSEIKQLGGNVTINSEWGKGTEFVVRLPFTVSVNRALMVAIGKDHYAVPLNTIEGIVRVSPYELEHYYSSADTRFEYAGENYQVRYLGAMLYQSLRPKLDGQALPLPVLLVRSAEHTMALQVDAVMGSREIVVKSVGSQFASVQGMSGATVMGDGSVVVILDPHALVRREVALSTAALAMLEVPSAEEALEIERQNARAAVKTIMVVDDSVTVRKVTSRFLEREGYEVITAKDGVDALRILQDATPDLMLLDIEMPRMDGFEVAKNVRSTRRWKDIPIIMITSRTGEKHREHALSLGVNGYLGKPYQEDLLLEAMTDLLEPNS